MIARHVSLILLAVLALLAGCSKQPKPVPYEMTTQKKMQAAHHWDLLAKDTITVFTAKLDNSTLQQTRRVHISTRDNSAFGRALRSMLITELSHHGFIVSPYQMDALDISWNTQLVNHKADRADRSFPLRFTTVSALGLGVYKVAESSLASSFIAGGAALDALYEWHQIDSVELPHNEVLININLCMNDNLLTRTSGVYYVNDVDADHYTNAPDMIGVKRVRKSKKFSVAN